jgi:aryl-alcohol dehydrogenase-like predicted oxidoreductase
VLSLGAMLMGTRTCRVPVEETVGAFGELVASGEVGLLGVSNHWSWRVERARSAAAALGVAGYEVLQYHHTYLRRRADLPGRRSAYGSAGVARETCLTWCVSRRRLRWWPTRRC